MAKVFFTKDNKEVYIVEGESHPHREDLIAETLSKVTTGNLPFIRMTVDLGHTIGVDHLVATTENDEIVYFNRGGRNGYESRMVLGRKAEDTSKVSVVMVKADDSVLGGEINGKYVLITLFEGELGQPEPYGRNNTKENREFWTNHALVPTKKELERILS